MALNAMAVRSVTKEADDILLAAEMIRLGARLQVLQAETAISYDRLARLYREIRGCSPPKGMLPFSVDWFMTWLPNIHASLFYNVYRFFCLHAGSSRTRSIIDAYWMYLEHVGQASATEATLSFTRAWMLVRFFDSGLVQLSSCEMCTGQFVTHAHDPKRGFICAICRPPPRAGKTRAVLQAPSTKSERAALRQVPPEMAMAARSAPKTKARMN